MALQSQLQRNPKDSHVLQQSSIVYGRKELDRDRGHSFSRAASGQRKVVRSRSLFLYFISLLRQTETVSDERTTALKSAHPFRSPDH